MIEGIFEVEIDWSNPLIGKNYGTLAELNGQKREITLMSQDHSLGFTTYNPPIQQGPSLQNRVQIEPLDVGFKGSIELNADWGGGEGTKFSGGASFEARDKNGNYIEAKVEQKSDGSGNAKVSFGHEEEGE